MDRAVFFRLLLVFSLLFFLMSFLLVPKSNCDVCNLNLRGDFKGYRAILSTFFDECGQGSASSTYNTYYANTSDINWGENNE